MTGHRLYIWEVMLASDESFGALREPNRVAWVTATTEEQAVELVKSELGEVAISGIEQYDLTPPRVIAFGQPG